MPEGRPTLAVAATFSVEPLEESLAFWIEELGWDCRIEFAPFSQVIEQLLTPDSLLRARHEGWNLIVLRLADWRMETGEPRGEGAEPRTQPMAEMFLAALREAAAHGSAPYLVALCPSPPAAAGQLNLADAEATLAADLARLPGVFLVDVSGSMEGTVPEQWHEPAGDELARIPYTPLYFAGLGTAVIRRLHGLAASSYKVIALDCDHTLWCGVCAEDGAEGLVVDAPRRALQEFMVKQQAGGRLLCLCSRNSPEDIDRVWAQRDDLVLRPEHFVARRINWLPKSENLRSLAAELQADLASLIFVGDDPVEAAEIQDRCPSVLSLTLPTESRQIPGFLRGIWAFDLAGRAEERIDRTSLYRDSAARRAEARRHLTLEGFLESLDLDVRFAPLEVAHAARVSELTHRVTQFNPVGARWLAGDIAARVRDGRWSGFVVEASDRFGDYGLVGAVVFERRGAALHLAALLLSCRALGKGIEHRILAHLGGCGEGLGAEMVEVFHRPTNRNQPALDFLLQLPAMDSAAEEGGRRFRFHVSALAQVRFQPVTAKEPRHAGASPDSVGQSHRPDAASGLTPRAMEPGQRLLMLKLAAGFGRPDHVLRRLVERGQRPRPRLSTPFAAPVGEEEEALASVWRQVLRMRELGRDDNFFELGGHSILAVQILSRVRERWGVQLPMRSVFQSPTVAEMAVWLRGPTERPTLAAAETPHAKREPETSPNHRPQIETLAPGQASVSDGGLADVIATLRARSPSWTSATFQGPVSTLAIPTRDRSALLARCAGSYLEHLGQYGETPEVTVMDGSTTPSAQELNRDLLRGLAAHYGGRITYAGTKEKVRFIRRLTEQSGVPEDVIRFAILGIDDMDCSAGANRNAILLQTVGEKVLSVDDDTLAHPGAVPDTRPGIVLTSVASPEQMWYGPASEVHAQAGPSGDSIFTRHGRLLGADPYALARSGVESGQFDCDRLAPGFLERLHPGTSRVLVSVNGLRGDCGWNAPFGWWGHPMGFLLTQGPSRERLLSSEAAYRAALCNRNVLRGCPRLTLAESCVLNGTFCGFDNRAPLPPFLPVCRGQDLLFSLLLRATRPQGCFGFLPFTLAHLPEEVRKFHPGEIFSSASGFDLLRWVIVCVRTFELGPDSLPAHIRLQRLGERLGEIAAQSPPDLNAFLRDGYRQAAASFAEEIELALAAHRNLPEYWARDLQRYLGLLHARRASEGWMTPMDLLGAAGNERQAFALGQTILGRYGALLRHWPELASAAERLRQDGVRLAAPVC